MKPFSEAALVVAHPDDEVLWFSSLIGKVARIVICYGPDPYHAPRAAQRRQAIEALPIDNLIYLDLPEPGRWHGRALGAAAVELQRTAAEDPAFRSILEPPLRDALAGMSTVFAHNPWGEYGHDDHRRVYSVIETLRRTMGFDTFVSSYVERRAVPLMQAMLELGIAETIRLPVSRAVVDPIVQVYKDAACWTWFNDWTWPPDEVFLRLGQGEPRAPSPVPLHLFTT